jgi:DNA repair protein RadC
VHPLRIDGADLFIDVLVHIFTPDNDAQRLRSHTHNRNCRAAPDQPEIRHPMSAPELYPTPANRLRSTALGERPQERLEKFGAAALSDTELLAMLLRSGTRGHDVLTLAQSLIAGAGSLAGLIGWTAVDFQKHKGIGPIKALQLVTVVEVARRVLGQQTGEAPLLTRAELIVNYMQPFAGGLEVEKFWILCLNRRNRLLRREEITSGTAHGTLAHPREVFRVAIRESASAVVCIHNHPSGDPTPSSADLSVTRQLAAASKAVDIPLIDHLIIGRPGADPNGLGFYSFAAAGLI